MPAYVCPECGSEMEPMEIEGEEILRCPSCGTFCSSDDALIVTSGGE